MGTIIGSILSAVIIASVTFLGLYLTEKSRLTKITDDLFSIWQEWNALHYKKTNMFPNEKADIQLKMKHLLYEAIHIRIVRMSKPQLRLIADSCEELLYYNEANNYWKKCFKKKFDLPEIEAEYRRRYAQFLYQILDYKEGNAQFINALSLKGKNDGQKYINICTYQAWINCIFRSENNRSFDKNIVDKNSLDIRHLYTKALDAADSIERFDLQKSAEGILDEIRRLFESSRHTKLYP